VKGNRREKNSDLGSGEEGDPRREERRGILDNCSGACGLGRSHIKQL